MIPDDAYLGPLRPYQRDAVRAAEAALAADPLARPAIKIATGGGKSMVLGALALRAAAHGRRVLILAHRAEIVKQNAGAVKRLGGHCGLVLASEGAADMRARITSAMVNSLHAKLKRPRGRIDAWDVVLIDEAHTVPVKGEGMYRTILLGSHCAQARKVGVTATPSRLDGGPIYPEPGEEVGDCQFSELAYELGMDDLVAMGYLVPLKAVAGRAKLDLSGVKITAGDYNKAGMAAAAMAVLNATVADILDRGRDRHMWLVFASGKAHGERIAEALREAGVTALCVTDDTSAEDRRRAIAWAKAGRLRALVNCGVFTTGTDIPRCDMVVLARATQSAELYAQMVGRASRLCPDTGKRDGLVVDIGGNVERHGAPGQAGTKRRPGGDGGGIAPVKSCSDRVLCPKCRHDWTRGVAVGAQCPGCGITRVEAGGDAGDDGAEGVNLPGCGAFAATAQSLCWECLLPFPAPPRKLHRDTFEGVLDLTADAAGPTAKERRAMAAEALAAARAAAAEARRSRPFGQALALPGAK